MPDKSLNLDFGRTYVNEALPFKLKEMESYAIPLSVLAKQYIYIVF